MPVEESTHLSAKNLTKTIGSRTIVDSVSFGVNAGEVFGFLGPNGAGKTTTIRMLVGLIRPTAGTVEICGHDIRHHFEEAMRCIGCIVENPDLYRFMTGRENLEHFGRMLRLRDSRFEIRDSRRVTNLESRISNLATEIERVAALVSMDQRLDQKVGTYSLGMRQRLGIAQAMLGKPRVLILDEPANGLDPAGIREIRELLRRLAAEGMSVFISSHLLGEVELMCDRVAIIHKGRLLRTGSVHELISSKRTMELRVGDAARAQAIVEEKGLEVTADTDRIFISIDEADAPPVIAALTRNGIDVFHARQRMQTLEDLFIEATGGETVG